MPFLFRNQIPSHQHPAEKGRYVLYINYSCPWSHRAIIVRGLKGLESIVHMVEVDARDATHGWYFSGKNGPSVDPMSGNHWLKEIYLKSDPNYGGRITVPMLFDMKQGTVVNNESSEIIRIFFKSFDQYLLPEKREANKGATAFIPPNAWAEMDTLNAWILDTVNNGVYKAGFARTQATYDEHVNRLFQSLDWLEVYLKEPNHQPYLFGASITEADIRLYTTLIRFDVVYYTIFKCNLKMIRIDYPYLHNWLRRLYWSEGPETNGGVFKKTTRFDTIKEGYAAISAGNAVIPIGPSPPIMPP